MILPEYKIDLLNKNKKIIKKVENIESIDTFTNNTFYKKDFTKKKFNKPYNKSSNFKKRNYSHPKKTKGNFENKKSAIY